MEDCGLQPSGAVVMAGSRLCVAPQPEKTSNVWNITPDGLVRFYSNAQLVLEVKGQLCVMSSSLFIVSKLRSRASD